MLCHAPKSLSRATASHQSVAVHLSGVAGQSNPPLTPMNMSKKRKASDKNELGGAVSKARQNVDVLIPNEVRTNLLTIAQKYHRRLSRR